jgi:hypothetical protein
MLTYLCTYMSVVFLIERDFSLREEGSEFEETGDQNKTEIKFVLC